MVTIRLFASLRDKAGISSLELAAESETTASNIFRDLTQRFPALAPHRDIVLVAVNEEYAKMGSRVCDGDEVAFFPPVSGG